MCIDVLIKNGFPINQEDDDGYRPIHEAALFSSVNAARMLLSIDDTLVNSVNSQNKMTPLHWASYNNRTEFVKYLLTQPGIQVNLRDSQDMMADEYHYSNLTIQQMIRDHRSTHM